MTWLKDIRLRQNKTQEEVAELADMTRAAYSNIEIGSRRPSVDAAKKIGAALGFNWTNFYDEH